MEKKKITRQRATTGNPYVVAVSHNKVNIKNRTFVRRQVELFRKVYTIAAVTAFVIGFITMPSVFGILSLILGLFFLGITTGYDDAIRKMDEYGMDLKKK